MIMNSYIVLLYKVMSSRNFKLPYLSISCIVKLDIDVNHYNQDLLIQMIKKNQFNEHTSKSPHDHIVNFLKHYDSIIVNAKEAIDIWNCICFHSFSRQGKCLVNSETIFTLHKISRPMFLRLISIPSIRPLKF